MEKREHFRVSKSLVSQIIVDDTSLFAITGDLSLAGIFLRSKRCFPVNSSLTIQIVLPDNSISSLRGIVRRTIDASPFMLNGMGIEITKKDSHYIQFVKSILGEMQMNREGITADVSSETTLSSIQEEKKGLQETQGEKRRSPRYIVNEKEIAVMIGSSGEAKVVDISSGGIAFKTDERLDHDNKYAIQLKNKDSILALQGTIKWIALNEYKTICFRTERIPLFHKELIPIYTVGMQFTNIQGTISDEVMQFLNGLTIIGAANHYEDPINLSDFILSEFVEATKPHRETMYQGDKSSPDKRKKSAGEKHKSALYCGKRERANLLKDTNKEVVLSVLENPTITVGEIEKFASSHTIPEEAIQKIIQNKTWMNHYGIVSALVNNPKAPPSTASALARKLRKTDLKKLARNRNVSEAVRNTAEELLSHNI
jgi:hypothetical protein